jgi:hypothetical protein
MNGQMKLPEIMAIRQNCWDENRGADIIRHCDVQRPVYVPPPVIQPPPDASPWLGLWPVSFMWACGLRCECGSRWHQRPSISRWSTDHGPPQWGASQRRGPEWRMGAGRQCLRFRKYR